MARRRVSRPALLIALAIPLTSTADPAARIDLDAGLGLWRRSGAGTSVRLDAGLGIPTPFAWWSSPSAEGPAWRRGAQLELRLGGILSSDFDVFDGAAFRAQVVLSGRLVPPRPASDPGHAYVADLSVAGIAGAWMGAEGGLDLHLRPWGGIYARVGYLWEPEPGPVVSVGIRLDAYPAVAVLASAAAAAVFVLMAKDGYSPGGR